MNMDLDTKSIMDTLPGFEWWTEITYKTGNRLACGPMEESGARMLFDAICKNRTAYLGTAAVRLIRISRTVDFTQTQEFKSS